MATRSKVDLSTPTDIVNWHDVRDPHSPELDELAARYGLHPLHIEDCRHGGQRAKIEEGQGYLFVVLKPATLKPDCELELGDFDVFVGRDFLITVLEDDAPKEHAAKLDQIKAGKNNKRPDQLFYRIFDSVVDAYAPMLDGLSEEIDRIEDQVLESPSPELLERIFDTKRVLVELRRVLSNSRDVAGHLQRTENEIIQRDLMPFLRDVYDHLARNLDMVEMHRDLLTGSMDIYLSSVANRTNQVMKVLTVMGTAALPALVISGLYGMNVEGLPWKSAPHAFGLVLLVIVVVTAALLALLRAFRWF